MSSLTPPQTARLRSLEETIERGLSEMGKAMAEIRRTRLYRGTHETFEAYCAERWGKSASRIRQLITASSIVDNLQSVTNGNTPEVSERQARELVGLEPEQQQQVWAQACEQGKPTAERLAEVRKAVESMSPVDQAATAEKSRDSLIGAAGKVIDNEGRRDRLKQIERLAKRLEKITEGLGPDADKPLEHLAKFQKAIAEIE